MGGTAVPAEAAGGVADVDAGPVGTGRIRKVVSEAVSAGAAGRRGGTEGREPGRGGTTPGADEPAPRAGAAEPYPRGSASAAGAGAVPGLGGITERDGVPCAVAVPPASERDGVGPEAGGIGPGPAVADLGVRGSVPGVAEVAVPRPDAGDVSGKRAEAGGGGGGVLPGFADASPVRDAPGAGWTAPSGAAPEPLPPVAAAGPPVSGPRPPDMPRASPLVDVEPEPFVVRIGGRPSELGAGGRSPRGAPAARPSLSPEPCQSNPPNTGRSGAPAPRRPRSPKACHSVSSVAGGPGAGNSRAAKSSSAPGSPTVGG
ncbi:hypothetical protein ACFYZ8_25435 [Streptomyces sp. NPDC001668]|uniref:hypothetical protein n=1 Tax=unclassified Streptomyces TaxID=2593676 RepID=UPI0036CFB608